MDEHAPAETARRLMLAARRASLATLMAEDGAPYASLVLTTPDTDGTPLLYLSRLAQHSRNLAAERRASLLIEDGPAEDSLAGARVTLMGRLAPCDDPASLDRYLAGHPDAATWRGFGDFRLWRLTVDRAHLVAGFGRIAWIEGKAIVGA